MHHSTFINITFHLAFYHPAVYCKAVLQLCTVSFPFYCFESVHIIINLCSSLFQIVYEDVIWSIWFIWSKLWKITVEFSGNHPCPKTLPPYSYLFFPLPFDADLLKQSPSFSGSLGGDKLADLPRVSEHETKCTLSALHRRAQLGQIHGLLLMPYPGHAPCSRRSLWHGRAKCVKDWEFKWNKKGWPCGVCLCLFGLFWPHSWKPVLI